MTVIADKVDVVPPPEDVASESSSDPPVTTSEDRSLLVEKGPEATDVAEARLLEDVRDVPPADAPESTASAVADAAQAEACGSVGLLEEAAAPLTEEVVQSNASPSPTVGVETGVEMLDLPTPKYPLLSRRRGEEGLVLLQVEVLPDGTVGDIVVLRDAGFRRLTEAAISAVRKGRFKPATRHGHPVQDTVRIPFRFVLR